MVQLLGLVGHPGLLPVASWRPAACRAMNWCSQPCEVPMTKTGGSSGQSGLRTFLCIYARAFYHSELQCLDGHEGALFMPCSFFCPIPCILGMTPEEMTNDKGAPSTMPSAPIGICLSRRSPSMCQYSLHFLHTKHTHWPCLRAYTTSRSKFTPSGLWFGRFEFEPKFHQTLHIAGSVSKFGTLKKP